MRFISGIFGSRCHETEGTGSETSFGNNKRKCTVGICKYLINLQFSSSLLANSLSNNVMFFYWFPVQIIFLDLVVLETSLAFRGHDESKESKNKGNFRGLV